ncbi:MULTISPECIES: Lsr2 family DNA-binding protein [Streptomyces]|uniref:Lsr2 family DNA-binding protein n=1 Tax=Streptomyces TaxID=1883 RepID=UPI00345B5F11
MIARVEERRAFEAEVRQTIEAAAKSPAPEWESTLDKGPHKAPPRMSPEKVAAEWADEVTFEVTEETLEEPVTHVEVAGDQVDADTRSAENEGASTAWWDAVPGEPITIVTPKGERVEVRYAGFDSVCLRRCYHYEDVCPCLPRPVMLCDGEGQPYRWEDCPECMADTLDVSADVVRAALPGAPETEVPNAPVFPGELLPGETVQPYTGEHHRVEDDGYDWAFITADGHEFRLCARRCERDRWLIARAPFSPKGSSSGGWFWWAEPHDGHDEPTDFTAAVAWCRKDSASRAWAADVWTRYGHMNEERVPWSVEPVETQLEDRVFRVERYGRVGIMARYPWGWEYRADGRFAEAGSGGTFDGAFRRRAAYYLTVGGLHDIPTERWVIVGTDAPHGKNAVECGPGGWKHGGCRARKAAGRFLVDILAGDGSVMGRIGVCAEHLARRLAEAHGHTGRLWKTALDVCGKSAGHMGSWVDWRDRLYELVAEMVTAALEAGEHNPRPDVVAALYAEAEAVAEKQRAREAKKAAHTAKQETPARRAENKTAKVSEGKTGMTAPKVRDITFVGDRGSERAELLGHTYRIGMLAGTYDVFHVASGDLLCRYEKSRPAMKRAILADAVLRGQEQQGVVARVAPSAEVVETVPEQPVSEYGWERYGQRFAVGDVVRSGHPRQVEPTGVVVSVQECGDGEQMTSVRWGKNPVPYPVGAEKLVHVPVTVVERAETPQLPAVFASETESDVVDAEIVEEAEEQSQGTARPKVVVVNLRGGPEADPRIQQVSGQNGNRADEGMWWAATADDIIARHDLSSGVGTGSMCETREDAEALAEWHMAGQVGPYPTDRHGPFAVLPLTVAVEWMADFNDHEYQVTCTECTHVETVIGPLGHGRTAARRRAEVRDQAIATGLEHAAQHADTGDDEQVEDEDSAAPVVVFLASRNTAPTKMRVLWSMPRAEAQRICSDDRSSGRNHMLCWTADPGQEGSDWEFVKDTGSYDALLAELGITPARTWVPAREKTTADTAEIPAEGAAGSEGQGSPVGSKAEDSVPADTAETRVQRPGLYAPVVQREEREGEDARACREGGHRYVWACVEAEGVARILRSYLTCECGGEKLGNFGRSGPSMSQGTQRKPLGIWHASTANARSVADRSNHTITSPWLVVSDTLKRAAARRDGEKHNPVVIDPNSVAQRSAIARDAAAAEREAGSGLPIPDHVRALQLDLNGYRWGVECDRHGVAPLRVLGEYASREEAEGHAHLHAYDHPKPAEDDLTPEEVDAAAALAFSSKQLEILGYADQGWLCENVTGFFVPEQRESWKPKSFAAKRVITLYRAGLLKVLRRGDELRRQIWLSDKGETALALWDRARRQGLVEPAQTDNDFGVTTAQIRTYKTLKQQAAEQELETAAAAPANTEEISAQGAAGDEGEDSTPADMGEILAKAEKQVRLEVAHRINEEQRRAVWKLAGERIQEQRKQERSVREPVAPAVAEGESIEPMNPGWAQEWWLFRDVHGYGYEVQCRSDRWYGMARLDEWTSVGGAKIPGDLVPVDESGCATAEELLELCREQGRQRAYKDPATRLLERMVQQAADVWISQDPIPNPNDPQWSDPVLKTVLVPVEKILCDAHIARDGSEVEATEKLTLAGRSWDLCEEHAGKFAQLLVEALGEPGTEDADTAEIPAQGAAGDEVEDSAPADTDENDDQEEHDVEEATEDTTVSTVQPSVMLCGEVPGYSCDDARDALRNAGYQVVGRADETTVLLILGERGEHNTKKLQDAHERGIPCMDVRAPGRFRDAVRAGVFEGGDPLPEPVRATSSGMSDRERNDRIREWGRGRGFKLKDRGRLPLKVRKAYELAYPSVAVAA